MTVHTVFRPAISLRLLLLILLAVVPALPASGVPAADGGDGWTLDILAQSDSKAELRPCT